MVKRKHSNWYATILDAIRASVADRSIAKEELADGLEEIETLAGEWAAQMRAELKDGK